MPRLKVPSLKAVKLFIDNPLLGDVAMPSAPIPFSLKQEFSEQISEAGSITGGVRVTAGVDAKLAVVNDVRDPNAEEFFDFGAGKPAAETPEAAPAIEPPVVFDPAKAYVVLSGVIASGRLAASGGLSALRIGLDGSANLSLASCTAFARNVALRDAADEVCEHFKTPFSLSDLRLLRPQETLVLGLGGTLKLSLELSASCLGDAVATGIQEALGRVVPIDLSVASSASLEVTAEISDGYRMYVKCGDTAGSWQFSVRKTSSRVIGIDGSVGVRVDLRDGQALARALSGSFARLTKLPSTFIEKALRSSALEDLSVDERALVEKAVDLLKLRDPAVPAWRRFKQALVDAEKRARAVIPQKLVAGLNYTWRRITADSHVARFTVDAAALEKHHGNILRLDLQPLIDEAKEPGSGIRFDRFLGKKVRKVEVGFGFCLALNDFVFLKGWDTRLQRYVWLRDLDGRVQGSFLGRRAYEGVWLGASEGHTVELDASMPRFTAAPAHAGDFELGLHVAFTWKNRSLDSILPDVADHAALVQALPATTVRTATEWLRGDVAWGGIHGDATVSLLVPGSAVEGLLVELAGPARDELLANALARALPCGEFGAEIPLRNDLAQRTAGYREFWLHFLRTPGISLEEIARGASRLVENQDSVLSRNERDVQRLWGWSVHGVVRNFGGAADLQRACDELRFGLSQLAQRSASAADHLVFERALKGFDPLWADHFGARVFASLLVLAAQRQPGALSRVARKVSLHWNNGGEDQTRVFKQGDETLL